MWVGTRPREQTGNFQIDIRVLEYSYLTECIVQHKKRDPRSAVAVLYASMSDPENYPLIYKVSTTFKGGTTF
jgi:hypothetical protein